MSNPIPTHEQTDQLARDLPADRTGWDGNVLRTDAERRFFGLRDSGYDGWVDQDGYPAAGAACLAPADALDEDEA